MRRERHPVPRPPPRLSRRRRRGGGTRPDRPRARRGGGEDALLDEPPSSSRRPPAREPASGTTSRTSPRSSSGADSRPASPSASTRATSTPPATTSSRRTAGARRSTPSTPACGLGLVKVIHANDSKKERGCRVDRHERIGHGQIGEQGFANLMTEPAFADVPKILETPKDEEGRWDREGLAALRKLARRKADGVGAGEGDGDGGNGDEAGGPDRRHPGSRGREGVPRRAPRALDARSRDTPPVRSHLARRRLGDRRGRRTRAPLAGTPRLALRARRRRRRRRVAGDEGQHRERTTSRTSGPSASRPTFAIVRPLAGLAERRHDSGVEPLPDDPPERGDDRGGREERRSRPPGLHEKRHGDERHEHDDRGDPREGVVVGASRGAGRPRGRGAR